MVRWNGAAVAGVGFIDHRDRSTSLTVLIALGGAVLFCFTRNLLGRLASDPDNILAATIPALVGAAVFARVSYARLPGVFTVLTRTTAAGILIGLIVEPPDFTLVNSAYSYLAAYVDWGYWPAVAAAALSIWRPSFLYPAAFYVMAGRYFVDEISGFPLGNPGHPLDGGDGAIPCPQCLWHRPAEDVVGALGDAEHISDAHPDRSSAPGALPRIHRHGISFGQLLLVGRRQAGSWSAALVLALEYQPQNPMLPALKKGVLPSGTIPWLTQTLYDGLRTVAPLSNVFVLVVQLFAVVAVLRVAWLRIASLAYDAFHIGIYIVGGGFFLPWIWNNVSIFLAVRRKSDQDIGWAPKLCCIVTILAGGSSTLGASATTCMVGRRGYQNSDD